MEKKKTYGWLSLCVAVMALLLPSTSAWADVPILTSGTCGSGGSDEVVWTFDEDTKTLTISPNEGQESGWMSDFIASYEPGNWVYPAPWKSYYNTIDEELNNGPDELIEHVVVEEGVRNVSEYAFYGLPNLKDVVLAPSVSTIGKQAFRNCDNLTSIVALYLGSIYFNYDDEDECPFENTSSLTLYMPQPVAEDFLQRLSDSYCLGNLVTEGFLLDGEGYEVATVEDSYELLAIQQNIFQWTAHLKGPHTATINGKTYNYPDGTPISETYVQYQSILQAGAEGEPDKVFEDISTITEPGNYLIHTFCNLFNDEDKRYAATPLFAVVASPTSGEGWSFDSKTFTLTISGDLTDEPWAPFVKANIINNVIVEDGVTKLPQDFFCDDQYYLNSIILQGTNVIELNGAFMHEEDYFDEEQQEYLPHKVIFRSIYVPSTALEDYKNTYADFLVEEYDTFRAADFTITLPASGIMPFFGADLVPDGDDVNLDFGAVPDLKAYMATDFNTDLDRIIMEPVNQAGKFDALVLKGTPNTTYTIPYAPFNYAGYGDNMLYKNDGVVDPDTDPYYAFLLINHDGDFEQFTEPQEPTGGIHVEIYRETFEQRADPTAPIAMLFSDEEAITRGTVESGVTWAFDADTKTLTIDSDDYTYMVDFGKEYNEYDLPAPWRTYTKSNGIEHHGIEEEIEHVVVTGEIYSIGQYAFYGLPNLRTVSLSPKVESISMGAFRNCPKLETVVLPSLAIGYLAREGEDRCTDAHGETFYVTNSQVQYLREHFHEFNINVEGFSITPAAGSEYGIRAEFHSDPLIDNGFNTLSGDIDMRNNFTIALIGDATATVLGHTYEYQSGAFFALTDWRFLKEGSSTELKDDEVTEAGTYRVKVIADGLFEDADKNTAISENRVILHIAETTGTGWHYDRDNHLLSITGNVTGEPWQEFNDDIWNVVVEEGVTQLPHFSFYEHYLDKVIIKATGVDLNASFLRSVEFYDEYEEQWCQANQLSCNIYVPANALDDYDLAYAEFMQYVDLRFYPLDFDITMKAESEGIMTFGSEFSLDLSGCPELKAYKVTDFDPATGKLTLVQLTQVAGFEGVLLMGEPGTYTAQITTQPYSKDNMLCEIHDDYLAREVLNEGVTYTNLVLAGTGETRGFHPLTEGGYVEGWKAYLQMKKDDFDTWATSHAPLRFVFQDSDDATHIEGITPADSNSDWYTLSGVRLQGKPTTKGLYIRNGKKYVVK